MNRFQAKELKLFALIFLCFWILCVFLFSVNAVAKEAIEAKSLASRAEQETHPVEYSILCAVTGFAYSRSEDSIEKQKELATQAASYLATKKANSIIGSSSKILPDKKGDLFRIDSIEMLDSSNGGSDLTGVRVFGEIVFSQPRNTHSDASSKFIVQLGSNKKQFTEGESIVLTLSGSQDFYGTIMNQSSSGDVIQLLPNKGRMGMLFRANKQYKFPDPLEGDDFHLEVSAPFGKEHIWLIASEEPFSAIGSADPYDFFSISRLDFLEIKSRIKKQLLLSLNNRNKANYFLSNQFVVRGLSLETKSKY